MISDVAVTVVLDAELAQLDKTWTDRGKLYLQPPDDRPGWTVKEIFDRVGTSKSDPNDIYALPQILEDRMIFIWVRQDLSENVTDKEDRTTILE